MTSKNWQPRKEWPTGNESFEERVRSLASETGLKPLTVRACLMRGLNSAAEIGEFLNPKLEQLTPPTKIKDIAKAVERLARARESKEKILIFGDYDVDGTTGAALLTWTFRDFGFDFSTTQPDRFRDGYGLNVGAVERAHADQVKVLVTVDCGITSFQAADKAQELGIDLVVVDHHQIDASHGLPKAHAIVNPQQSDCESGLKQLCGCGLAFYLSLALRAYGRDHGWFEGREVPNLRQHLDLVVMATSADMVPLTGVNHILVKQGLEVLKRSQKPGVRALLEAAGLTGSDVSPGHLGFVLGPRINASGRMGSAQTALDLLTTHDEDVARSLALELETRNRDRMNTQNAIWDEVRMRVEQKIAEGHFKHAVVIADREWHEGVVGIVASKVTEAFKRPAIVLSIREDGTLAKGSVRSYGGRDVLQALRDTSEFLSGFGGHRHAAGLSLLPEKIDAFAEAYDRAVATLKNDVALETLFFDGECQVSDLTLAAIEELERLGPFGPGNPEPVFVVKAKMSDQKVLKERHLKMRLGTIEAIWFNAVERELIADSNRDQALLWATVPEVNRFRGNAKPSLRVRDARLPI